MVIAAGLQHPHVVGLYDYWRDPDGACRLVDHYSLDDEAAGPALERTWSLESGDAAGAPDVDGSTVRSGADSGRVAVIPLIGGEIVDLVRTISDRQLTAAECAEYLGPDVPCVSVSTAGPVCLGQPFRAWRAREESNL